MFQFAKPFSLSLILKFEDLLSKNGSTIRYGTAQFLLRGTVCWYGTPHGTGTVRWYGTSPDTGTVRWYGTPFL